MDRPEEGDDAHGDEEYGDEHGAGSLRGKRGVKNNSHIRSIYKVGLTQGFDTAHFSASC